MFGSGFTYVRYPVFVHPPILKGLSIYDFPFRCRPTSQISIGWSCFLSVSLIFLTPFVLSIHQGRNPMSEGDFNGEYQSLEETNVSVKSENEGQGY